MADDDDWETDPDFENNMTETEKRRAGNVEHLNELNAATQSMSCLLYTSPSPRDRG